MGSNKTLKLLGFILLIIRKIDFDVGQSNGCSGELDEG